MPPPMHSDASPLLRVAPRHFVQQRDQHAAPDAPIGWPSAIAPPLTLIFDVSQPISLLTAHGLRGERLVDLHQVEVRRRPAGLLEAAPRRRHRAHAHDRRIDAGRRERLDARERLEAELFARSAVITSTAAAPSLMPEALAAVTRAVLRERGPQTRDRIERRAGLRKFVLRERNGIAFALRDHHRNDLVLEPARPSAPPPPCSGSRRRTRPARSREISYFFATFSAVVPMWYWL